MSLANLFTNNSFENKFSFQQIEEMGSALGIEIPYRVVTHQIPLMEWDEKELDYIEVEGKFETYSYCMVEKGETIFEGDRGCCLPRGKYRNCTATVRLSNGVIIKQEWSGLAESAIRTYSVEL